MLLCFEQQTFSQLFLEKNTQEDKRFQTYTA